MVIDTLDKLASYESLNPLFKDVVEFVKNNDLESMAPGKYPINGDDLFLNIAIAKGKTPDEAVLETHNVMIDIQIPLSCSETYGYTAACNLPDAEYNAELSGDIASYTDVEIVKYKGNEVANTLEEAAIRCRKK